MIECTLIRAQFVRVKPIRSWSDPRARAIAGQLAVVAVVVAIVATVAVQTAMNLRARGIASGFDFLSRPAGFEIARGLLSFSSRDTMRGRSWSGCSTPFAPPCSALPWPLRSAW
jgi:ABC-type amino acid transport system permease subunit